MTLTIRPNTTIRPNITLKGFTGPILKFDASNPAGFPSSTTSMAAAYDSGSSSKFALVLSPGGGSTGWDILVNNYTNGSWHVTGHPEMIVTNVQADTPSQYDVTVTISGGVFVSSEHYTFTGANTAGGWIDLTGNGHNATFYGDITYSGNPEKLNFTAGGPAEYGYAHVDQGVYFNGSFTVEGWVYVNSITNWARLFDFGNGAGDDNVIIAVSQLASGYPVFSCGGQNITSNTQLPLNQWVHLLATYNYHSETGTLYMNGTQVVQGYQPRKLQNNNQYYNYIGKSNWSGDANLEGAVGEFAIYPFAMSSAEVLAQYNNRKTHYGL